MASFAIPPLVDRSLRWLKYGVLLWARVFTWKTGQLVIRPYDPWAAYAHSFAGWSDMWKKSAVGISILIDSLGLGLFVDRVFCKYLCPLGAFLGIASQIGISASSAKARLASTATSARKPAR